MDMQLENTTFTRWSLRFFLADRLPSEVKERKDKGGPWRKKD